MPFFIIHEFVNTKHAIATNLRHISSPSAQTQMTIENFLTDLTGDHYMNPTFVNCRWMYG